MPDVYQGELGRPLLKGDVGVKTWRKLSPAEMKGSSLDTAHVVLAKKGLGGLASCFQATDSECIGFFLAVSQ